MFRGIPIASRSRVIAGVRLWRPKGTFSGGVFLPEGRAQTAARPIERLRPEWSLDVPLSNRWQDQPKLHVNYGDTVLGGQAIAETPFGTSRLVVCSPVSGRVTEAVRVQTARGRDLPGLRIEPDGRSAWVSQAGTPVEPSDLDGLIDRLIQAGVVGDHPKGPSLPEVLEKARAQKVRHLIVNAVESEPYLTSRYRLLTEYGELVVRTGGLLARLLGSSRVWLTPSSAHPHLIRELRRWAQGTSLRIAPVVSKYPQGATPLLVHSILGVEIPYGGTSMDVGALVLDTSVVAAMGQAIYESRPRVSRVITVAGDVVLHPGNYEVPFGTSVRHLATAVGLAEPPKRVVFGGAMTGTSVDSWDVVTDFTVGAVLFLSARQTAARHPGPCIRCGWCLEDCPVGLDPPAILAAVETRHDDDLPGLYPHACLGCGICTYVCPAELPLAEGLAKARQRVPVIP